ncbi:MAG: autotransporter domain-containing protein [Hyphomonadaceae bacterium]
MFGLTGIAFSGSAHAVVTPDDVPPSEVVDEDNTRPYLVGIGIRSETGATGGSCSGLLINPRTVLFAAHCVDGLNPDQYDGNNGPGDRASVGYTTDPLLGRDNLRNWLFQYRVADGVGAAVPPGDGRTMVESTMVWYDPRSRFGPLWDPNSFAFLPADIAIAAFDTPTELLGRDAENGIGLLFSPVDRLVPVTIGGYGQAGDGLTGFRLSLVEETFFRRVATNMLGFLGSERDLYNGTEPQNIADLFNPPGFSYQDLYWIDFDDPQNRPFDADLLTTNPGVTTTFDFNVFPDEPTANEAITAAGDSGSPLITDAYGREVSLGVLSQGSRFFHDVVNFPDDNFVFFPNFSDFGTVGGWNPLFLFWDQIVVNNPYKYVQARSGNREWTDPTTWVQEIDPLYYVLNSHGDLRNRLPNDPALGSSDATDNIGTINPNPVPIAECAWTGTCVPGEGNSEPAPAAAAMPAPLHEEQGRRHNPPPPPPPDTADWLTGGLLQVGTGALTGPGTTNFVPDNTDGTPGLQNSTRYFEVNLRNAGTLTLRNADIEIDRLNIRGVGSRLDIRSNASLTTNLTSYMDVGRLNVDGEFNTLGFDILFGILSGEGTIRAMTGVANTAGVVSPGGNDIGTLTIVGDYAQSGLGTVLFQIGRHSTDLLEVEGHVDMRGNLLVDSSRRLRYGDRFTVVHADSISGNFDRTLGSGTLLFGETIADADSIDLRISARRVWDFFHGSQWSSLALALDSLRFDGHYSSVAGVFDLIDNVPIDTLGFVLPTLTPTHVFSEMPLAISYSQGFTRDLFARTAELRAGQRGISERSLLSGYRMLSGTVEEEDNPWSASYREDGPRRVDTGDRLGFFFAGQGDLNDVGQEAYQGDRFNPASLSQASTASMTIGADYRISDHFAIGVASTVSRYLVRDENATPLDHTGYGAMAYASAWHGGWFADAYAGVAQQDYLMNRSLLTGGPLQQVESTQGAVQSLAGIRGGYTFRPMNGLTLSPTITLNYSHLNFDGYRESGGGDFDLLVDERSLTSMTVESALEFSYQPIRNGRASPFAAYGRFAAVNEIGDGSDYLYARFAAAPEIGFSMSQELDREWYSAAGGLSYMFGPNTSLSLEASTELDRDDYSTQSLQLNFNHRF